MRSLSVVRLLVALVVLAAVAIPAAAGTLYVPISSPELPAGGSYKLRVWLTNSGSSPATVQILGLQGAGDGTKGRGKPETRVVPAGSTLVLFLEAEHGLLEIQAPDSVAVNAELRNTSLPGPREVFGSVPVIGSGNLAKAGETLLLQGLRRSTAGVSTHVGLVSLGHQKASCDASLHAADGRELLSASLSLPALSHMLFPDALVKERQIGDVHARISCDRPFYAYLAMIERDEGKVVFVEPSPTGGSTLEPPGAGAGATPASFVFKLDGTFHVPSAKKPTLIRTIQAPRNQAFKRVVLEMDFTHGGWYAKEPDKNHNLFWLHRGGCCWPDWPKNILGFVNAWGPKKDNVKAIHNVDYQGRTAHDKTVSFAKGVKLEPGKTYHLRYEYDAAGGRIRLTLWSGGKVVMDTTSSATTNRIRSGASGQFMAYFGHENVAGTGHGPERPTYNWKYSNLRVEFIP